MTLVSLTSRVLITLLSTVFNNSVLITELKNCNNIFIKGFLFNIQIFNAQITLMKFWTFQIFIGSNCPIFNFLNRSNCLVFNFSNCSIFNIWNPIFQFLEMSNFSIFWYVQFLDLSDFHFQLFDYSISQIVRLSNSWTFFQWSTFQFLKLSDFQFLEFLEFVDLSSFFNFSNFLSSRIFRLSISWFANAQIVQVSIFVIFPNFLNFWLVWSSHQYV